LYADLLSTSNQTDYLTLGVSDFQTSLKRLETGNDTIPAPHSQFALDRILDLSSSWPAFKAKLLAQQIDESD